MSAFVNVFIHLVVLVECVVLVVHLKLYPRDNSCANITLSKINIGFYNDEFSIYDVLG